MSYILNLIFTHFMFLPQSWQLVYKQSDLGLFSHLEDFSPLAHPSTLQITLQSPILPSLSFTQLPGSLDAAS